MQMKEIVRQMMKIRVWALAALAAFACVGGAWAGKGYVLWKGENSLLDGYVKDGNSKASTTKMGDYPVYLIRESDTTKGNFVGIRELYAAMESGTLTVSDIKAGAVARVLTNPASATTGGFASTLARLDFSAYSYFFLCTFSPDEKHVYFSSMKPATPTTLATDAPGLAWSLNTTEGTGSSVFKDINGDRSKITIAAWYRTPTNAWKTVAVVPAQTNNMTAVIVGTDARVLDDGRTCMVNTNVTFAISYTPNVGYVFSDGATEKTYPFSSDKSPVVDTNLFDVINATVRIGARGYRSFEEALEVVQKDETITLLDDVTWRITVMPGKFKVDAGDFEFTYECEIPSESLMIVQRGTVYEIEGDYYEATNIADGGAVTNFRYFTNAMALAETDVSITNLFLRHNVNLEKPVKIVRPTSITGDDKILAGAGFTFDGDGMKLTIRSGLIDIPYSKSIVLEGGRFISTSSNFKDGWSQNIPKDYAYYAIKPSVGAYDKQYISKDLVSDMGTFDTDWDMQSFTNAEGHVVSIPLKRKWAITITGNGGGAASRGANFSAIQANGLTFLENAVFGLLGSSKDIVTASDRLVPQPVQSTDPGKVTFRLGNFSIATSSKAKVSYCVFQSDRSGGKDAPASDWVNYDQPIEVDLPTDGVRYYVLDAEVRTVE